MLYGITNEIRGINSIADVIINPTGSSPSLTKNIIMTGIKGRATKRKNKFCIIVKSKFSTNNFKKIRIPQFSETRFGSFVGLFLVYKQ